MSEGHSEDRPPEGTDLPIEPAAQPPPAAHGARPRNAWRPAVLLLSVLLILVVAGVALSPFWAPNLAPLLPWGATSSGQAEESAALASRVAAIENRPTPPAIDTEALKSAIGAVARRADQLESAVNSRLADIATRPVAAGIDVDAIKSDQATLIRRIDQLEERLAAAEGQSSARAASEAAGLEKINGELARLGNATADLAKRLPELEQQTKSQSSAERAGAALALIILRIREAVDRGHPFAAEYSTLQALARDTDLSSEAEPLADAAQSGVASRALLSRRLAELAGLVATATERPSQSDWGAQTLARLRALVTIRRIDGPSQTAPEAAASIAQAALARGDLSGAVAALEPLTGANAEAARPWLQMARQRLAVETALDHLQQSLADRIGPPQAAPAGLGAKTKGPS
jgi:hypothetical protein